MNETIVPAHTGGADLSVIWTSSMFSWTVPAHTGGADLSTEGVVQNTDGTMSPPTRAGRI